MNIPVLLITFNRPEEFSQVLSITLQQNPSTLYIAVDGARTGNQEDLSAQNKISEIIKNIPPTLALKTKIRSENVGCKTNVSEAISWFFENEERGIILEDDCIPQASFFPFCEELLERYKDNETVMHIAGSNYHYGKEYGNKSYYFSKYNTVWGWASWRRAWKNCDMAMKGINEFFNDAKTDSYFLNQEEKKFWHKLMLQCRDQNISTFDYQWLFSCWKKGGMAIHPNKNLVSNVGIGNKATNTFSMSDAIKNRKVEEMKFPLQHPTNIEKNKKADAALFYTVHHPGYGKKEKIFTFLKKLYYA